MRASARPLAIKIGVAALSGVLFGAFVMQVLSFVYDFRLSFGGTDADNPPDTITPELFVAGMAAGSVIFGLGAFLIHRLRKLK